MIISTLVSHSLVSNFLNKLQNQPKNVRKIILWAIVIIVALGLASWWICSSYWKMKKFPAEEFMKELELPKFK